MRAETTHQQRPRFQPWQRNLIVILVFLITDQLAFPLYQFLGIEMNWDSLTERLLLNHSWQLFPPLAIAALFFGFRRAPWALGLQASLWTGLAFGMFCTLPMLIGYALFGSFSPGERPLWSQTAYSLFPGVFEEIFFRGFLFGLLFRFGGWGFLPASLLGAVFFGAGHMWQGADLAETVGVVAITATGAVWFAYLYAEWDDNLWVPITFHVLMNAWWGLFAISDTALGGAVGNIFRFATIALSIAVTVGMVRRRGSGSRLHGRWLVQRAMPEPLKSAA
ncbi:MAG: CPBP family intramembrane glutamic endopeptidase [Pseudomonadota bacterium]